MSLPIATSVQAESAPAPRATSILSVLQNPLEKLFGTRVVDAIEGAAAAKVAEVIKGSGSSDRTPARVTTVQTSSSTPGQTFTEGGGPARDQAITVGAGKKSDAAAASVAALSPAANGGGAGFFGLNMKTAAIAAAAIGGIYLLTKGGK